MWNVVLWEVIVLFCVFGFLLFLSFIFSRIDPARHLARSLLSAIVISLWGMKFHR